MRLGEATEKLEYYLESHQLRDYNCGSFVCKEHHSKSLLQLFAGRKVGQSEPKSTASW